jgi:hypothetical protein
MLPLFHFICRLHLPLAFSDQLVRILPSKVAELFEETQVRLVRIAPLAKSFGGDVVEPALDALKS